MKKIPIHKIGLWYVYFCVGLASITFVGGVAYALLEYAKNVDYWWFWIIAVAAACAFVGECVFYGKWIIGWVEKKRVDTVPRA